MTIVAKTWAISGPAVATERGRVERPTDVNPKLVMFLEERELPGLLPGEVLVRVLAVSIEGNVAKHLVTGYPVNQAEKLGGIMYPGNSMVAEVIDQKDTSFDRGDIVVSQCWEHDHFGDPKSVVGFDSNSGWYGDFAIVHENQLLPAPLKCGLTLYEMAALTLKAPCALHLWRRAQMLWTKSSSIPEQVSVLGFGGGVSQLFLLRAKQLGHKAYYCSGNKKTWKHLHQQGVVCLDQIHYNRFASGGDVKHFRNDVLDLTGGRGVHLVCDLMRGLVFEAGLAVMAKHGINLCCGWQLGNEPSYNQARLCINQQDLVNVHMASRLDVLDSVRLWGPNFRLGVHAEIFPFERLPEAVGLVLSGNPTGSVIVQIAKDLPRSVLQ